MLLIRVASTVLLALAVAGCTATTVVKPVAEPVPVAGLNIIYVSASLTASRGKETGTSRQALTATIGKLGKFAKGELPSKFEEQGIAATGAAIEPSRGGPPVKVRELFPRTAGNYHVLVLTPVSAEETCQVQRYTDEQFGCFARLTVSAKLFPPGKDTLLWEARIQEPQLNICGLCDSRFSGFVGSVAQEVTKAVVYRPATFSAIPTPQQAAPADRGAWFAALGIGPSAKNE